LWNTANKSGNQYHLHIVFHAHPCHACEGNINYHKIGIERR